MQMIPVEPKKQATAGAFPMERFKELFKKSYAMTLMPAEGRAQVQKAMDENDFALLEKIYQILLQEQTTEQQIAEEFATAKNRIMDNYVVAATDIRKKYTEAPMKEKIAAAVAEEKKTAEEMLKKI